MHVSSNLPNHFSALRSALSRKDLRATRTLAAAVRVDYVPVHDGFRDAVATTLTHLARFIHPDAAEIVGRKTIENLMGGGDPPQYAQAGLRDRVKAIAFGWHWHVTRFTVSEDDVRVTFKLHPCGSGMRLIHEGYYSPGPFGPPGWRAATLPRLDRSSRATWSSFMSEGFPTYCNHCSEMGHVGLAGGAATFLVEGWTPLRQSGICLQHTYKDPAYVPDEFYRRVDLALPQRTERDAERAPTRLFSDDELLDLQTHPLDKLVDRAERGEWESAADALAECLSGWRDSIHDVYRNWLCVLWKTTHDLYGMGAYADTVKASAPDLFAHMRPARRHEWAKYWAMHLRLKEITDAGHSQTTVIRAGQDSLLQRGMLPTDAAWFAEQLVFGLKEHGWDDVGTIKADGDDFVHTIKESAA